MLDGRYHPTLFCMPSTLLRWIASLCCGFFIGHASFGVFNPLLSSILGIYASDGTLIESNTVDHMLMGSAALSLLTAIAAVFCLVRSMTWYQLLGRACVMLGITLIFSFLLLFLTLDNSSAGNDGNAQVLFWMLLLGLPYLVSGALLSIGGRVILLRDRAKRPSSRRS